MGIHGTPGASLRGWARYFPYGSIFGADIDRDILFQTDRIKTYYCDQTNPQSIRQMWANDDLSEPFDIIIEDGLHEFDANVCFFENSIHKLKKGGYYIIEDIDQPSFEKWTDQLNKWKRAYPDYTFTPMSIPSERNKWDNNLLVVEC
jgi:SAM-dependent methyltransferase